MLCFRATLENGYATEKSVRGWQRWRGEGQMMLSLEIQEECERVKTTKCSYLKQQVTFI